MDFTADKPCSSLFPKDKPVLKGVLVITSIKTGKTFDFVDIPTANVVQLRHPAEAQYVFFPSTRVTI